jgi:uncharacterized protein
MSETLLLWELFLRLRRAGMKLSIDQYEQARQSLYQGYGLAGWEDLQEICRLLWVKPHLNYDARIFEHEFDLYRSSMVTLQSMPVEKSGASQPLESQPELEQPGRLPQLPPRVFRNQVQTTEPMQTTADPGEALGVTAAKGGRKLPLKILVPLDIDQIAKEWRSMNQPLPDYRRMEIDFRETKRRIEQQGIIWEEAQKPLLQKQVAWLVLVDDSNAMVPFRPVIQPLIDAILSKRISGVQIRRFNSYPVDFLYDWQRPLQGKPIDSVLSHFQMVMVVSDGGAASRSYQEERIQGMKKFIDRLGSRQVLWLNPVPAERWEDTSAEIFAEALGGRMIGVEPRSWGQLAKVRYLPEVQSWLMV